MSTHNLPSIHQNRGSSSSSNPTLRIKPSAQQNSQTSKLSNESKYPTFSSPLQRPTFSTDFSQRSDPNLMRLRVSDSTPSISLSSPRNNRSPTNDLGSPRSGIRSNTSITAYTPTYEDRNDAPTSPQVYHYFATGEKPSSLQSIAQPTVASLMKLLASSSHIQSLPDIDRTGMVAKQQRQRLQRFREAKERRSQANSRAGTRPGSSSDGHAAQVEHRARTPMGTQGHGVAAGVSAHAMEQYASSYLAQPLPLPTRAGHASPSQTHPSTHPSTGDHARANAYVRHGQRAYTPLGDATYAMSAQHGAGRAITSRGSTTQSTSAATPVPVSAASAAATQEKERARAMRERERAVRRRVHAFFSATPMHDMSAAEETGTRGHDNARGSGSGGHVGAARGRPWSTNNSTATGMDAASGTCTSAHAWTGATARARSSGGVQWSPDHLIDTQPRTHTHAAAHARPRTHAPDDTRALTHTSCAAHSYTVADTATSATFTASSPLSSTLPPHACILARTSNDYATNAHGYTIASAGNQAHRANTPASLATVALRDAHTHPHDWSRMNLRTMKAFGVSGVLVAREPAKDGHVGRRKGRASETSVDSQCAGRARSAGEPLSGDSGQRGEKERCGEGEEGGEGDMRYVPRVVLRKDLARWMRKVAEGKVGARTKKNIRVWVRAVAVGGEKDEAGGKGEGKMEKKDDGGGAGVKTQGAGELVESGDATVASGEDGGVGAGAGAGAVAVREPTSSGADGAGGRQPSHTAAATHEPMPRVRVVGCSRAHAHALVFDKHAQKRAEYLSRLTQGATADKLSTMRGIQVELWGKQRFTFTGAPAEGTSDPPAAVPESASKPTPPPTLIPAPAAAPVAERIPVPVLTGSPEANSSVEGEGGEQGEVAARVGEVAVPAQ